MTMGPPVRPSLPVRVRGKLWPVAAWGLLVLAMRRRRPTELWIGDSHAMTFNQGIDNAMFFRGPDGQLILRLGARLMWSLGTKGFPPRVHRVSRLVRAWGRPGSIVPVFCAGEIDVRAHLAGRPADFGFVDDYVDRCVQVGEAMRARTVAVVVPPPAVAMEDDESWYPIVGSVEERIAVHRGLRAALAGAVRRHPGTVLLDFTELLADASGAMPVDRTVDGCHTNLEAVALIRRHLAETGVLGLPTR
jgi:hypothetical protein